MDWNDLEQPAHQDWLRFYRQLLKLRKEHILPRLSSACKIEARYTAREDLGLTAEWKFGDGAKLTLLANFSGVSLVGPHLHRS